jgi:hypothetical protein
MGCFTSILVLAGFVMVMVSLIRWFEQTADAVDRRDWSRLFVLIFMPFSVWIFPSRSMAGRPTAVPRHEPVRGFGSLPKSAPSSSSTSDQPPPGTPKEFLELPKPKPAKPRSGPDPDKIAKLKEKMRQQGMLPPE